MGQGKLQLVMVLIGQTTFMKQLFNSDCYYTKIRIHDFQIFDNQLDNARVALSMFCPISPKWDMNISNILFTLSWIRHEQT